MTSPAGSPPTARDAADPDQGVRRIVDRLLARLGMDVAYLTEFRAGRQVFRGIQGHPDEFGIAVGSEHSLDSSLCRLMVDGEIPNVVSDTARDERLREVRHEFTGSVGAYIGVPVHLDDGTFYGSLCCLSREPKPDLDERDVAVVQLLAEFLAEPLAGWRDRRAARQEIRALLEADEIVPAMQPIVSLVDGRGVGVEALARFPHSRTLPEQVFSRAREAGLDDRLEHAAIRAALAQRDRLAPGTWMSVNVGPAGLLADGFEDMMREYGPLEGLLLEITEHVSVAEYAALASVLQPLRDEGLRLAVDDVGAGYASLRHVLRMAPDVIKIDRSLVNGIARDAARRTILTGIVLLALDLDADTIAEGVETAADVAALTDLGVDMVQGYLLAEPTTDRAEWRTWATPWLLPGQRPDISRRRTSTRALLSG